MFLSRAITGFLQYKAAEGLSPTTLQSYQHDLNLWMGYVTDVPLAEIDVASLKNYFVWLRTDYKPRRVTTNPAALSPKTIHNFYISLSVFFTWVGKELNLPNPIKTIPAPKCEEPPVEPYTKEEVESLLKDCEYSRKVRSPDRRTFTRHRASARRDQVHIMTLLDTGLRASELSALTIGDVDLRFGKVVVKHGRAGAAKGGKGRSVFLGKAVRRAMWLYLASREDGEDPDAPLFLGKFGRPLTRDTLRQVIASLGEKAGVKKCHPHRFRHAFAITYLRSGGDLFALQALLGHSSLDIVQYYAHIAEVDIEQAHKRASPADNWRL